MLPLFCHINHVGSDISGNMIFKELTGFIASIDDFTCCYLKVVFLKCSDDKAMGKYIRSCVHIMLMDFFD